MGDGLEGSIELFSITGLIDFARGRAISDTLVYLDPKTDRPDGDISTLGLIAQ